MSNLDLPASMKPKLAAIETAINDAFEKMRAGGRMMVEGALEIGQQLTIAKKIIIPQQWLRWCEETLPFATRTAQARMKMWSNYIAAPETEQTRLLESTTSIKGAISFLETDKPITEILTKGDEQRGAHLGKQITEPA